VNTDPENMSGTKTLVHSAAVSREQKTVIPGVNVIKLFSFIADNEA
jgi:hypothetical protein